MMTTTTTTTIERPRRSRERPRRRGAVLALAVGLTLSGCSTTPETAEADLRSASSPTAATTTATVPAATTTTAVGAPDQITPIELVRRAVTAARDGYDFDADIVVDGNTVGEFGGRYRPGGAEVTVAIAGADVRYILTEEGQWVDDGGEWVPLDGTAPLTNPLGDLAAPIMAAEVSSDPQIIEAVYAGRILGVDSDQLVVRLTIADGRIVEVTYEQPLGAQLAAVTTVLDYTLAGPPITAPVP